MTKIEESIKKLLTKNRIIIWYDEHCEFEKEFAALTIEGLEKRSIHNNEFALKHEVVLEKPDTFFLLYGAFKRPPFEENWLLDLELSNYVFSTDQASQLVQELGLEETHKNWLNQHLAFFRNSDRLDRFRRYMPPKATVRQLELTLLQSVFLSQAPAVDSFLARYARAFMEEEHAGLDKALEDYAIKTRFWEMVEHAYGYRHEAPGIYDFLLACFHQAFDTNQAGVTSRTGGQPHIEKVGVLLSLWKDTRSFETVFRALSQKIAGDLNVSSLLENLSLEQLAGQDLYREVDIALIKRMSTLLEEANPPYGQMEQVLKKRLNTHWYDQFSPFYQAIEAAIAMLQAVPASIQDIHSLNQGIEQYTSHWYKIDQQYRLFLQHYRQAKQSAALQELYQKVHKVYSNTWLVSLSNAWQKAVDQSPRWYQGLFRQQDFFKQEVQPYLEKDIRVFVIISDALRYECGAALHHKLTGENRFSSRLEHCVTNLPSYTQLGMAGLLPHQSLAFGEGEDILADGLSTKGAGPRSKVLAKASGVATAVISAEELMKINSRGEEAKALVKEHQVVYVYHNRIDKTGDDKTQEDKVIEAVTEELKFLVDLCKKIANVNVSRMIITADHGFIYQNDAIEESDFTDAEISGEKIKTNRRFVLGKSLKYNQSVNAFTARQLGLESDLEILIPKGINRLRVQGAGSRYVHGGASLQETVVPVLHVAKKKSDTLSKVEVDVLNRMNNRVTTNIHRVGFYQTEPVSEQVTSRTIKAYFALITENNEAEPVSDIFNHTFDSTSERAEEREVKHKFTLNTQVKSSKKLCLVLQENVGSSNQWNELARFPYKLDLLQANDFD